jgi:TPR repeat protein
LIEPLAAHWNLQYYLPMSEAIKAILKKMLTISFTVLLIISCVESAPEELSADEHYAHALSKRGYDDELSIFHARQAAEAGHAEAMMHLAWMLEYGEGALQDYAEALHWFKRAAEQSQNMETISLAETSIGYFYLEGLGTDRDYSLGIEWLESAADKGSMNALFYLATVYENGDGVEEDIDKALEYYLEGVIRGDNDSLGNAFILLKESIEGKNDVERLISFFEPLLLLDNAVAYRMLGYWIISDGASWIKAPGNIGIALLLHARDLGDIQAGTILDSIVLENSNQVGVLLSDLFASGEFDRDTFRELIWR